MDNKQTRQCEQPQEMDLVDLFVVLYRRRGTIMLSAFLCVALAVAYWFVKPTQSFITAVVATGNVTTLDGVAVPVMNPSESERLLSSIYIPNSIDEYSAELDKQFDPPTIRIFKNKEKNESKSSVIVLTCETKESMTPIVLAIMNSAVEDLVEAHSVHFKRYIESIDDLIGSKNKQLEAVKSAIALSGEPSSYLETQRNIEASILKLQSQKATSYPSRVERTASPVPQTPPNTAKCAAVLLIASLCIGCFVAFFFDLLARAKARETAK